MAELALRNVDKTYNSTSVLQNINVVFSENQITAIVGKSGSGKTTLLKLLNGLEKPDAGEIIFSGEPLNYSDLPRQRRKMGYAVQGNALFPHLTVAENISCLARLEDWSDRRIEERLNHLLVLTQLPSNLQRRFPHELSGGQQQRVGLCRALMLNPPVILLDEPFAAIDPATRREILEQFLKMQLAEPRTALLVTHDIEEALFLADDILVLNQGRVDCHESKKDLIARIGDEPLAFIQEFLV